MAALDRARLRAPKVIWNAEHGFPTFQHTAANIGWQYPYIHPLALLEYIVVQFGVFGPILMVVCCARRGASFRNPSERRKILLLSFSLPVLALLARSGAALARPRQLVGDRLSCRDDPRHRGDARAQPAAAVPHFARAASRHCGR